MYDAVADPYCYPGTTVLKNISGLRDQAALDEFEAAMTAQRADEALPSGHLSVTQYCAIHRHLFQDVYSWAGQYRTVRISKDGSAFCYPEHIAREMNTLFATLRSERFLRGLSHKRFVADAAQFLTTLNAIHPFREGNGRTQTIFLMLVADRAGHPVNLGKLDPRLFLEAIVASFKGNRAPLEQQIFLLTNAD